LATDAPPLTGSTTPAPTPTGLRVVKRYARLFAVQMRTATIGAMQYRADFVVRGLIAILWLGVALAPILVVFGTRAQVAGWTFPEALVVVAWFTLLKAVLEGAVSPSLTAVVEHVRHGTLDFVLLKPADAQFLVSTAKFEPWRVIDLAGALVIFGYAFHRLGRWPNLPQLLLGLVFLVLATVVLYSIWILVVSAAFWVVKVDNLSYLFGSLFDAGRWPIDIFRGVLRGALRFVFTFIFPLALMTTYPARALLGKLDAPTALAALGGGAIFAAVARGVWKRALAMYTSASS
jgi:viologen exporter family transport system permease protein